jgi:hypothetical protein
MDAALQAHLGQTFDTLETNFIAFLRAQPVEESNRTDLRLSVAFYDTARRYQQMLDPSAYFLSAWLPDISAMRQRGIVADVLRHPQGVSNLRVEGLLVAADADLRAGRYGMAELNIRAANALLNFWGNTSK